jgi:hypothetical protein
MMPEAVIFSVDFFNAFYMVTSMQNASSTTTVAVIMAMDVFNTVLALRGLQKNVTRIMGQLGETKCSSLICWKRPAHFVGGRRSSKSKITPKCNCAPVFRTACRRIAEPSSTAWVNFEAFGRTRDHSVMGLVCCSPQSLQLRRQNDRSGAVVVDGTWLYYQL